MQGPGEEYGISLWPSQGTVAIGPRQEIRPGLAGVSVQPTDPTSVPWNFPPRWHLDWLGAVF